MNTQSLYRWTGFVFILQGLLIFVPLIVLGAAIEWPASLGDPAAIALPRLHENLDAVRIGYGAYLAYSVLFLATSALLVSILTPAGTENAGLRIAFAAGALSALARTIGIIRWLVPMPELAEQYVDPATSAATRETISVAYETLNLFGGSIGELLGVTIFAAIWVAGVSVALVRHETLPRWLGGFGLLATAAMLVNLVEVVGIDLGGLISATVTIQHLWFLAVGIVLIRRAGA